MSRRTAEQDLMRAVICHFYNEEYLLPWWLQHHLRLFDYGVMINHSSTDRSAEIVREMAPHWRLVNTRLTEFDSALTDLEVSNYEWELPPGAWKIALNATEFVLPVKPMHEIEAALLAQGRIGCACSAFTCVDDDPARIPDPAASLPLQKHWGLDENITDDPHARVKLGLAADLLRNRFYHSNAVGHYGPGRHWSFHPDWQFRSPDLMIFHYFYAPWNPAGIQRKTQIKSKLKAADVARGWGTHHTFSENQWQERFDAIRPHAHDLREHPIAGAALACLSTA
jgi:hypothetical protein